MTIRFTWQELRDMIAKQMDIPGLQLGEPRLMQRAPYGEDEPIQDGYIDVPIITERPRFVEPINAALQHGAPATPDDDMPF